MTSYQDRAHPALRKNSETGRQTLKKPQSTLAKADLIQDIPLKTRTHQEIRDQTCHCQPWGSTPRCDKGIKRCNICRSEAPPGQEQLRAAGTRSRRCRGSPRPPLPRQARAAEPRAQGFSGSTCCPPRLRSDTERGDGSARRSIPRGQPVPQDGITHRAGPEHPGCALPSQICPSPEFLLNCSELVTAKLCSQITW